VAQGDATYLIVKDDGTLTDYGLNAVCTHLGCVVPWNKASGAAQCMQPAGLLSDAAFAQAENKFKCPCHGSQYNNEGKVIRGPAPLVRAACRAGSRGQRSSMRGAPVCVVPFLTRPPRAVAGAGALGCWR